MEMVAFTSPTGSSRTPPGTTDPLAIARSGWAIWEAGMRRKEEELDARFREAKAFEDSLAVREHRVNAEEEDLRTWHAEVLAKEQAMEEERESHARELALLEERMEQSLDNHISWTDSSA